MAGRADLVINMLVQSRDATRGINDVQSKLEGFGNKASALLKGAAAAGGAALIKSLFNAGVEAEALGRRFDTVFGEAGAGLSAWADDVNERFGLSEAAMKGLLASVGDLLVPLGMSRDAAADTSAEVATLANALSEWSGGQRDAKEVTEILTRAMLGEREALISLGVKIDEATVQNELAKRGLDKLTGVELQRAKAMVTLELIQQRSTDAVTAYEDGAGGAMEASKKLAATMADLQTEAGLLIIKLAPLLTTLSQIIGLLGAPLQAQTGGVVRELADNWEEYVLAIRDAAEGNEIFAKKYGAAVDQANANRIDRGIIDDLDQMTAAYEETVTATESLGGMDMGVFKKVAEKVRKLWREPIEADVHAVIGAFDTMPEQIELSLAEFEALLSENIAAKANWEANLATLKILGFDALAVEMEAKGPAFATTLDRALGDPTHAVLERMEADLDEFDAFTTLFDDMEAALELHGIDFGALATLRSELGITEQAWMDFWSAANGGSFGGVTTPGLGPNTRPGVFQEFHSGGIVPGLPGTEVPAILQAGETVIPRGGGAGGVTVNMYAGTIVTETQVEALIVRAVQRARERGGPLGLG